MRLISPLSALALLSLGALACAGIAGSSPGAREADAVDPEAPAGAAAAAAEEPPPLPPLPPVLIEAEAAQVGSDFEIKKDGEGAKAATYVSIKTDGAGDKPDKPERTLRYAVTFPGPGDYNLYVRLRVGPQGANDDSLFFARAFGEQDAAASGPWIMANNLGEVGASEPDAIVAVGSLPAAGTWNWVNLSTFVAAPGRQGFKVEADQLSQVFEMGARENGLDIDKIAFAPARISHTVAELDGGLAGKYIPPKPPPPPFTPSGPALAQGQSKFLGCTYSPRQAPNFTAYFNQLTPENAGKWGSVEPVRDQMNWAELDAAFAFAKKQNLPIRMHVLVWGNQQPAWIETLPPKEQLEEIEEWFQAVAARYPDIDMLEVVNEPLHDPPNKPGDGGGNYIAALGGDGKTGWDWILTSFRMARKLFPEARLMLNEYSVVNTAADAQRYKKIIELLKAEKLVDVVGIQGHSFETTVSTEIMAENLELIASAGVPLVITEMDIDGASDERQLAEFKRIFPLFWEHPSVQGVTLWGYRPGMWRTAQGAYLALDNGAERPALQWLREYVAKGSAGAETAAK